MLSQTITKPLQDTKSEEHIPRYCHCSAKHYAKCTIPANLYIHVSKICL